MLKLIVVSGQVIEGIMQESHWPVVMALNGDYSIAVIKHQ